MLNCKTSIRYFIKKNPLRNFTRKILKDTGFHMSTSNVKFGKGTTKEIGLDFADMGIGRVLFITDPNVRNTTGAKVALQSLRDANVEATVFDDISIEPTDVSITKAVEYAKGVKFDGIAAVGGGSVMDTAKAVNLFTSVANIEDLYEFINPPIGAGRPVPSGLKPLIAVSTTSGTGSENTGVVIFDILSKNYKTGIAHRNLKPNLAIVDPDNTISLPKEIAVNTGFDVLCHAIESYTALPYNERLYTGLPSQRPSYQGRNPVSDVWSEKAIQMAVKYLPELYKDPAGNEEAREAMIFAASYASFGFGNSGVHLCHGMSYPIAGISHAKLDFIPAGYAKETSTNAKFGRAGFVPHGLSVVLSAPAVFSFIADSCPDRIRRVLELFGEEKNIDGRYLGETLAETLKKFMKSVNVVNGLSEIGFKESDIQDLVQGTLPQHRVTKLSPKTFTEKDLAKMFHESMKLW